MDTRQIVYLAMHFLAPGCFRYVRALAVVALLAACSGSVDQVPFPAGETEFGQPSSNSFKFGDPLQIEWEVYDPASLKAPVTKKFNYNALPARPFVIGYPTKMAKPAEIKDLNWEAVPDTIFDYNNLPSQPLKFKTFLSAKPGITKAGVPIPKIGTTRGVMDVGAGLGLPGNGRCFLTDAAGMLWIGTDKGLCRYDGVNLEVYGIEQGISDPNIWSVAEDSKRRIWLGTASGNVFVFDRAAGLIHQLMDTFPRGPSYSITRDASGQMWIVRNNFGVIIVNEDNKTVKQFSTVEGLSGNFTIAIISDKSGHLWFSSNNGVTVLDPTAKKNKQLTTQQGLISNSTFMINEDHNGNVWIGGNDGVCILNAQRTKLTQLGRSQGLTSFNFVLGIHTDRSGVSWLGTDAGTAFAYDPKSETLEKFVVASQGNFPFNLFEDKKGQLWIGTTNGGCYLINRARGRPSNLTQADGLSSTNIWSIIEASDGKIWIGTSGGIDIYDPATQMMRHLGIEHGLMTRSASHLKEDSDGKIWAHGVSAGITIIAPRTGEIQHLGRDQGLKSTFVQHLVEDNTGNRWLTTDDGEVFVYNFGKKLYKRIKNLPSWKGDRTYFATIDKNGSLWFGSGKGGVLKVDADANTMVSVTTSNGLVGNSAYAWLEGKSGEVWIGTSRGINQIDADSKRILSFTTQEGLAHNEVWTLNERNRILYAGTTRGLGLIGMETDSVWRIINFGKSQGLLVTDFDTNSGLVTSKGEFWAGLEITTLLVMDEPKFDSLRPVTHISNVQVLGRSIASSDRKSLESELTTIDTIWNPGTELPFPSKAQVLELYPDALPADSIDDRYFLPMNPTLEPDQNYISFSFAGMDMSDPDQMRYRYILEGIDKAWSPISAESVSETYRDLPPGKYNFKVSSRGMNGLWSPPASFSFTILPPWWKSWWAYLGYFVLLGFAGWRVHLFQKAATVRRERERTRDRELAQAKEIEKAYNDLKATQSQLIQSEKMASLGELTAGIAHEIQNPLNFVNNFAEVNRELLQEMKEEIEKGNIGEVKSLAGNIVDNEEKILFHGKRADSIVKGMLQHSRASSGVKEPTDINALADEYLRLAYHGLRAKDKSFNAAMKTDLDPDLGKVNVVPQDLGRVILNLITNGFYAVVEKKKSVMNGFEPTVTVITRKSGDQVKITVQDNGNGIPQGILDKIFQPFFTTKPSGQGTGLGLSMSYDIVTKVHGGKIDVQTKPGEGTSFILTIPNKPA